MGGRKGGRKRIPTAIHVLQGGRKKSHRPLPKNEPKPPPVIPGCPKHLDKEAKDEWERMSKELLPLGLLTSIDKAIFASYCQAWSTWVEATERVRDEGLVIKASTGTLIFNPYLSIENKANEQMLKALVEIGMSPASRGRVKVPEKPKKDEADEFLKETSGK
jgi:P27 family predicted phage terminase small subunit